MVAPNEVAEPNVVNGNQSPTICLRLISMAQGSGTPRQKARQTGGSPRPGGTTPGKPVAQSKAFGDRRRTVPLRFLIDIDEP